MSPEDRLKALRAEMDRTMAEYHNAVMRQAETYHEYKKAMKERSNSQND
ncbi:hypothetical protein DFO67_1043 [Modicisalibacter xianhensis]|uniref:Uncharacterized protein n=2 Tax=Modicisalibacter xianhensis TaxID=442341 RepID=A0A4R8FVB4_9GAMM|nr:hypothetical protein DFO67_1043 [Halomonas xianhensis]